MRIVLISDTHGQHDGLVLPAGDLLIHAGDFSKRGRLDEVAKFMDWFGRLPHTHKVLIAGNHDFLAEKDPHVFQSLVPTGVTYLNDSGTAIGGFKIWGSPIQPWFYDWAFNRRRGADIQRHWDLIPTDTDILITHGPPLGVLDKTVGGDLVGCADLIAKVQAVQPRLHVFGHIHEAHGQEVRGATTFVNAAVLDLDYKMVWGATELDL
jgi:Icc-related predicted phosphoesterase